MNQLGATQAQLAFLNLAQPTNGASIYSRSAAKRFFATDFLDSGSELEGSRPEPRREPKSFEASDNNKPRYQMNRINDPNATLSSIPEVLKTKAAEMEEKEFAHFINQSCRAMAMAGKGCQPHTESIQALG
jgi:hypothetical protein